jgi:hypothetical protein
MLSLVLLHGHYRMILHYRCLRRLDIAGCPKVTAKGIQALAKGLKSIQQLDLRYVM